MQAVIENENKLIRKFMFEEMVKLRNGDTDIDTAITMSVMADKVIKSYRNEIDQQKNMIEAVRVVDSLKDKNISYAKNLLPAMVA
jgi:hypothetical protein